MNIAEIIKNVTPEQLTNIDNAIKTALPLIESKLPMLQVLENAWRKEFNINESDIILYSAVKSPNNKKVFFYVFTAYFAPEDMKFSNDRVIKKNAIIITSEIKSVDLLKFLAEISTEGLNGVMDMFL